MNYGYIRVSTDAQTTRNQRYEILLFCKAGGMVLGVSRGTLYRWLKGRG